jgi:hypothetical protein
MFSDRSTTCLLAGFSVGKLLYDLLLSKAISCKLEAYGL